MSTSSPAPVDAPASDSRNRVFVTGAGFTRALVPNAPLLIDDFGNDTLADRVRGLPNASRLLEWERNRHVNGHIDSEALKDLPREDIHVVNLASDDSQAENIRTTYRSALGDISEAQFHLDGALDWIRRLPT